MTCAGTMTSFRVRASTSASEAGLCEFGSSTRTVNDPNDPNDSAPPRSDQREHGALWIDTDEDVVTTRNILRAVHDSPATCLDGCLCGIDVGDPEVVGPQRRPITGGAAHDRADHAAVVVEELVVPHLAHRHRAAVAPSELAR